MAFLFTYVVWAVADEAKNWMRPRRDSRKLRRYRDEGSPDGGTSGSACQLGASRS